MTDTREQLLRDYIDSTERKIVGDFGYGIQSPALAEDYLRFLTGRDMPRIIGNARDWDSEEIAHQLKRWAEYIPGPFPDRRRPAPRHRSTDLHPLPGDLVVFDAAPPDSAHGTLGVFVSATGHKWLVYTQGPDPAKTVEIDIRVMRPLGWWRVLRRRIEARGDVFIR